MRKKYAVQRAQEKRERLNSLSLTTADVRHKVKGMDFEDIVCRITP